MPQWQVPLADVVVPEDDIAAVADTYRSGWLSMGPQTEAFEAELAAFTGAEHAIAVANGTVGLHLMCAALRLGAGDEVIVPSLTFVATPNAVAYTGASPVFADIAGVDRPWLSTPAVEALITPRTRAVMNMSYGGHAGETQALRELADSRGLVLLEDAAHGLGGTVDGRALGRAGLAGAYSFFSNKNLAVGEGGAVVTDDGPLAERMRLLRSHGMTTLTWDRHRGHAAGYDVVALGFNYRIDEPRAALGRRRLTRLADETAARASLADRYTAELERVDGVTPGIGPSPAERPAHHLYTVVLDASRDRDAVRAAMAERGIQTSMHYPPAHRFSIYSGARHGDMSVTERYAGSAMSLPLFAHMTNQQQDLVLEALAAALSA